MPIKRECDLPFVARAPGEKTRGLNRLHQGGHGYICPNLSSQTLKGQLCFGHTRIGVFYSLDRAVSDTRSDHETACGSGLRRRIHTEKWPKDNWPTRWLTR